MSMMGLRDRQDLTMPKFIYKVVTKEYINTTCAIDDPTTSAYI